MAVGFYALAVLAIGTGVTLILSKRAEHLTRPPPLATTTRPPILMVNDVGKFDVPVYSNQFKASVLREVTVVDNLLPKELAARWTSQMNALWDQVEAVASSDLLDPNDTSGWLFTSNTDGLSDGGNAKIRGNVNV
jgi:hypothetical protein